MNRHQTKDIIPVAGVGTIYRLFRERLHRTPDAEASRRFDRCGERIEALYADGPARRVVSG